MSTERSCTRKDFFKTLLAGARDGVVDLFGGAHAAAETIREAVEHAARPAPSLARWVRPPGALPAEREFLAACTNCDDCVKACPHWVIKKAGFEFGNALSGSPIIVPGENPCLFCEGLPCIAACGEGALIPPRAGERPKIGIAVVDEKTCYQALEQPCDYCQQHCPEKPKAIICGTPGKAPRVDQNSCTGCGKCAQICPASSLHIDARAS